MKVIAYILALTCVIFALACIDIQEQHYQNREVAYRGQFAELQMENSQLRALSIKAGKLIETQEEIISMLKAVRSEPTEGKTDRGAERGERRLMDVTAYDLSYQSCGKRPNNPLYGITASGRYVEEWNTIAAGPELPFGTKVYIPYFKDAPNRGIFTVQDRGGAIKNGRIDVYMKSYEACMEFGRQQLEVYVLVEGGLV